MKPNLTSNRINIALLVLLVLLGIGSITYNQYLVEQIVDKERSSVELWARAIEYTGSPASEDASRKLLAAASQLRQIPSVPDNIIDMIESAEADRSSENFVVEEIILKEQFQIPRIIVNQNGEILSANYISGEADQELVDEFAALNPPIEIELGPGTGGLKQFVYYGESPTVQYLRYFPYIQLSLLALLLGIAFLSYRMINRSEQSNILVGMTKEAAHQLGTPLSSMYGWIELLREERKGDSFVDQVAGELENDVTRLRGVAERFNKIGSEPELEEKQLLPHIEAVMDYMERRLPQRGKNVKIERQIDPNAKARINPELFEWALENIVKNSMNAIKATKKGAYVSVKLQRVEDELIIDIEDSGRGIEKKFHDEIFKPGYSTKKRGWGLGLSLTKRIIEDYHNGKIFVLRAEVGVGTTIRIVLKAEETAEDT